MKIKIELELVVPDILEMNSPEDNKLLDEFLRYIYGDERDIDNANPFLANELSKAQNFKWEKIAS